jgi:hypothetical protein
MLDDKDFQKSLFPELEADALQQRKKASKEKWLAKKNVNFGMEYCNNAIFSGKYGIPLLKPYLGPIPEQFITFSETKTAGNPYCCVTSFDHDYVIDRMWDAPDRYIEKLSHYMCLAEPDYSLKVNHPLSVQISNTYRSHAVAYYMQEHDVNVLPSMSWSSTMSYDFCFDGHSKGGAVIISTIGALKDERARMYFRLGFFEMLKRISPDAVILYGDTNDEILAWMPKQLDIHFHEHERYKRARNHGK